MAKTQSVNHCPYGSPKNQTNLNTTSSVVRAEWQNATHTIHCGPAETILEAAMNAGVETPFTCREGCCGSCMFKLEKGSVKMARNRCLSEEDIKRGYYLACQSIPTSPEISLKWDSIGWAKELDEQNSCSLESLQEAKPIDHVKIDWPDIFGVFKYKNFIKWMAHFTKLFERYGEVFYLKVPFLPIRIIFSRHPRDSDHVFKSRNFIKKTDFHRFHNTLFGEGVVTISGPTWQARRKLLQGFFRADTARACIGIIDSYATQWLAREEYHDYRDISDVCRRLTLDISIEAFLSPEFIEHKKLIAEAMDVFCEPQGAIDLMLPNWVPTPQWLKHKRAMRQMHNAIDKVLHIRRSQNLHYGDYLESLMEGLKDTDSPERVDKILRDEMVTLLVAGHETTASGFVWMFYELAKRPKLQDELHQEIVSTLKSNDGDIEKAIDEMSLVDQVVHESLRLHPPIALFIPRANENAEAIGGVEVPPRTIVVMITYLIQRHPGVWDRPNEFDPSRFANEKLGEKQRLGFVPFANGRRKCAGVYLALYEMKVVLARVLEKYRIKTPTGFIATPISVNGTYAPREGMPIELTPRTRDDFENNHYQNRTLRSDLATGRKT
ncbi:MAG: cytochrome P450 [Deltaproteobacteria bacterium]|nr:cytochrome P450 [Deltaproteobacteria bacterium]